MRYPGPPIAREGTWRRRQPLSVYTRIGRGRWHRELLKAQKFAPVADTVLTWETRMRSESCADGANLPEFDLSSAESLEPPAAHTQGVTRTTLPPPGSGAAGGLGR